MEELQDTLANYGDGTGLTVTSINLNVVDYPKSVQEAVDDTQKARNDRERYRAGSETYAKRHYSSGARRRRSASCRMPRPIGIA